MVTEFKDFLMRGNVVDLAVAVVVGAAFSGVVKGFLDGLVNPLIAAVVGAGTWTIQAGKKQIVRVQAS